MNLQIATHARVLILAALSAAAVGAGPRVTRASTGGSGDLLGDRVTVGGGTARAYVTVENGEATAIGVVMTEGALAALPSADDPAAIRTPEGVSLEQVLPLPDGNPTPYRHVVVAWNPVGARFALRFYTIDEIERAHIDRSDPGFDWKAARVPAAELIPAGYARPAAQARPRLGVRWVHRGDRGEVRPGASFDFASWDGSMIAAEPVVARSFLASRPRFAAALPRPARADRAGFYPAGWSVRWNPTGHDFRITLTGLDRR